MPFTIEGGWRIDCATDGYHQQALHSALVGDFVTAQSYFDRASDCIADSDLGVQDIQLQSARMLRDQSFTQVRVGIAIRSGDAFRAASAGLEVSTALTGGLLTQLEATSNPAADERLRTLYSEHGATLSLSGRLAVARQVAFDSLPSKVPNVRDTNRQEQATFGRDAAHGFLVRGSNTYYEVSNAMHGARAELLNRRNWVPTDFAYIAPWVGRATAALARARHDKTHSVAARNIVVARIALSMRSRKSAAKSVLARP